MKKRRAVPRVHSAHRVAKIATAATLLCGCFIVVDFSDLDPSRPAILDEAGLNDGSSSGTIVVDTGPPDAAAPFTLESIAPITMNVSTTMNVKVTAVRGSGFNGPISLAVVTPPSTFTFTTAQIESGATSAMLTVTAPGTPHAKQTITIEGTSGNVTARTSFDVTVTPPPGTLDETFGVGGILGVAVDGVYFAEIQANGTVHAVTAAWVNRIESDGGIDTTFSDGGGGKGRATIDLENAQINKPRFEEDGTIHAAGWRFNDAAHGRLVRVSPSGSVSAIEVDASASDYPATAGGTSTKEVLAQADGGPGLRVQQFASGGALDPSFGFNAAPYAAKGIIPRQVYLDDASGNVWLFGEASDPAGRPERYFAALRLTGNGGAQPGFGTTGLATVDVSVPDAGGFFACQRAQVFDGDGGLYIAGSVQRGCGVNSSIDVQATGVALRIFRLAEQNGVLDTTFGGAQGVQLPGSTIAWVNAIALQPDGKLLVAGGANIVGYGQGLLLRVLPNGTLDPTFTSAAFAPGVLLPKRGADSELIAVRYIDSRIVLVGREYVGTVMPFLARVIP